MPPFYWDETITVFNKSENKETGLITWYKHILQNCFWKESNNEVSVGNVKLQSNGHIVRIPHSPLYVSPTSWNNLPNDTKAAKFTLQTGDILLKGTTDFVVDEMQAGSRMNDLIAQYEYNLCTIKSVNENIKLPNAHYFVRGE